MKTSPRLEQLPGGKMIEAGLADLQERRCTIGACLVAIGSPRLRARGLLPGSPSDSIPDPERQLYRLLLAEGGDAYSRYNSLLRELVSFENALDRQSSSAGARKSAKGEAEASSADAQPSNSLPPEAYAISQRLAQGFNAEQVYLFGSYARNSAGPDSDLDFLVVVPHSQKTRYQRAVDALGFVSDVRFPADIIVLTQNEWDRDLTVVCSLASTVRREGVLLNGRQKS